MYGLSIRSLVQTLLLKCKKYTKYKNSFQNNDLHHQHDLHHESPIIHHLFECHETSVNALLVEIIQDMTSAVQNKPVL